MSGPELHITGGRRLCSNIDKAWNFFRQFGAGKRLLLFLERQFGCLTSFDSQMCQTQSSQAMTLILVQISVC